MDFCAVLRSFVGTLLQRLSPHGFLKVERFQKHDLTEGEEESRNEAESRDHRDHKLQLLSLLQLPTDLEWSCLSVPACQEFRAVWFVCNPWRFILALGRTCQAHQRLRLSNYSRPWGLSFCLVRCFNMLLVSASGVQGHLILTSLNSRLSGPSKRRDSDSSLPFISSFLLDKSFLFLRSFF